MNKGNYTLPWLICATAPGTGEVNVRLQILADGGLLVARDAAGKDFRPATMQEEILTVGQEAFVLDTAVADQIHDIVQAWKVYTPLKGTAFDPLRRTAVFLYEQEAACFQNETGWRVSHVVLTKSYNLV